MRQQSKGGGRGRGRGGRGRGGGRNWKGVGYKRCASTVVIDFLVIRTKEAEVWRGW